MVAVNASDSIIVESLEHASELHARAKKLISDAEAFKVAAREYIIANTPEGEDPATGWVRDPKGTLNDDGTPKTLHYQTPSGTIVVTRPQSSATPAHFDESKVERLHAIVADTYPDLIDAVFVTSTLHQFSENGWLAMAKLFPDRAGHMHEMLEEFIIPEKPAGKMSERVEVK